MREKHGPVRERKRAFPRDQASEREECPSRQRLRSRSIVPPVSERSSDAQHKSVARYNLFISPL